MGFIGRSVPVKVWDILTASDPIPFNNTTSGLAATDVESAIDEIDATVDTTTTNVTNIVSGTTDITYDNTTSGLTATTIKNAIDEVDSNVGTVTTNVSNITSGTTDITYDNATSGLTATTIKAAIDEVDSAVDTNVTNITNITNGTTDISYSNGTSGLTATTVQGAIDEIAASSGGGSGTEFTVSTFNTNLQFYDNDYLVATWPKTLQELTIKYDLVAFDTVAGNIYRTYNGLFTIPEAIMTDIFYNYSYLQKTERLDANIALKNGRGANGAAIPQTDSCTFRFNVEKLSDNTSKLAYHPANNSSTLKVLFTYEILQTTTGITEFESYTLT